MPSQNTLGGNSDILRKIIIFSVFSKGKNDRSSGINELSPCRSKAYRVHSKKVPLQGIL